MRIAPVAVVCLLLAPLSAQRPDATFEWQKRATAISYGAVPVGKHSLAELAVGQNWRLGFNLASTWQVDMPLLAGDRWIAPGQYRITFVRDGETSGSLVADGCAQALGGGADARIAGEITEAGKASKKLEIDWKKEGKAEHGNQTARVTVQFGPTRWQGDVLALGHDAHKVRGGKLLAFRVPAERVEQDGVPVASLLYGKDGDKGAWNLVLAGDRARFVPWMQAPTTSFGFGDIVPPDRELATEGTVNARDGEAEQEEAVWTVLDVDVQKGDVVIAATYGKKTVDVTLPLPKPAK